MLPHPGLEIPDTFLQTDVRRAEVNDRCLLLNNQCLQGGDYGWNHLTGRERNTVRLPTPVNGYIRSWFPTLPVLDKTEVVGDARHRRLTAVGLLALFGEGFRIDRTTRTGLGVAAELFRLAILVGFRGILRDDVSYVRWRGSTSLSTRRGSHPATWMTWLPPDCPRACRATSASSLGLPGASVRHDHVHPARARGGVRRMPSAQIARRTALVTRCMTRPG